MRMVLILNIKLDLVCTLENKNAQYLIFIIGENKQKIKENGNFHANSVIDKIDFV